MPRADRPWLRCRRSDTSSVGPAFNGVFVGVPPDAVTEGDGWVSWSGLTTLLDELAAGLSALVERLHAVVGLLSD